MPNRKSFMRHPRVLVFVMVFGATISAAQITALPQIRPNGAVKQLFVDNKPFIVLGGELHNSSASSTEYMKPMWDKLAAMHLNTVIGTVSWELIEPDEGKFDFSLVDNQIDQARQHKMHLVLIWFATWKNATSSYVPQWVKADRKRFPPMVLKVAPGSGMSSMMAAFMEHQGIESLSPLGEETLKADKNAFRMLMRHIKQTDPQHTVIMMQVENESGSLGDSRDRSPLAEAAWKQQVPAGLMTYLTNNKSSLLPEMQQVWGRNGYKTSGTWAEVFGSEARADEVFMADYIARFIGEVAKAGKAELNIPMYANAWLGPQPGQEVPGQFPSGGPVAGVLDVYRAAAPSLDFLSPDIYIEDFKGTCALYTRAGNPLFIPEARDQVGNLFWALGNDTALGWSPFGVEDLNPEGQVPQAYKLLSGFLPQLTAWQAAGKVRSLLVLDGEKPQPVSLGGYKITLSKPRVRPSDDPNQNPARAPELPGAVSLGSRSMPNDTRPFALVVNTAPNEFLFIGANGDPTFETDSPGPPRVTVLSRDEGRYHNGTWIPGRRLNGDELFVPGLPGPNISMLKMRLLRF
jgi:Domain of unknown function (DUF5597)/Beta-galactosidase